MRSVTLTGANLLRANLRLVDLEGADLQGVNGESADLENARLRGVRLAGAHLRGANLQNVDLRWANLAWADLKGVDLTGSDLRGADFSGAHLQGVRLTDAICARTTFADCDLSGVTGLGAVHHLGLSSVATDVLAHTLRGTGGRAFTEELLLFFARAGVSMLLLEHLPELFRTDPLQFYSCLVQHTEEDRIFAAQLVADLTEHGVHCWHESERAGTRNGLQMYDEQAQLQYEKVIVVLSKNALENRATLLEIERALQKEAELRRLDAFDSEVLAPVCLDDYVFREWRHPLKANVVAKHVLDFSDSATYEREIQNLIRALAP